ncbi:MAG: ABC transporter ATP-binding protein [Oscillospiraceae bacterium]
MNTLEIKGLCKSYGDFKLNDINLAIPGGSIMGLIGENGAGKSTTIKCILNLVRRDAGEISIFGRDNIADECDIKEDIGVVLDESSFHEMLRASDVGRIMSKLYKNWDNACFESYLSKFDLPREKKFKEFSKGMKMKLSIAAALSHHPKLLILDEATGGLDPVVRNELLDEFLEFIQDESHAVLISSHITSDIEKAADYVTYLHGGRVAIQGAKDELLERYGRLVCSSRELDAVDKSFLSGVRRGQFGCEALVSDRRAFRRVYPELTVDPASLEEIMVFTVKEDAV